MEPTVELPKVRQDFLIPVGNVPELEEALAKLNKRAAKIGCAPVAMVVTGPEVVKELTVNGHKTHVRYVPVMVTGETPRIGGYDFIATLQHLGEAGNLIRSVPGLGEHVPERFRTARPDCDHCGTFRARKDTYVLRHVESGEWKQVGSSCLADFLRTVTPEAIAGWAELLHGAMDAAEAASEGGGGAGSTSRVVSFGTFMAAVVAVVRHEGAFVSKTKARIAEETGDYANAHSTVGTVETLMFGTGPGAEELRRAMPVEPADVEKARTVLAWGRAELPGMVAAEPENDYLYNLSVVAPREWLDFRMLGIAASLIAVYDRDLAKKAAAKIAKETLGNSAHFGTPGERVKFLGVTLLHTFRSDGGKFGPVFITKLLTDAGNVAVWFASGPLYKDGDGGGLVEYGGRVVIDGTVKRHDERDGIKQTILSRCTVWTDKGVELELAKREKKATREAAKAAKETRARAA